MKRLYRSKLNRVFAGVCGGLGDYFNVDPVILRLVWVVVTFLTGVIPGIAAYIVCAIIVPPTNSHVHEGTDPDSK